MIFFRKRVSLQQQLMFLETMLEMEEQGFAVQTYLAALKDIEALSVYAENILDSVKSGIDLIDAIVDEDIFDPEVVIILRAAAREDLKKGLREAVKWLAMKTTFSNAGKSALVYPVVLFIIAHIVLYSILLFVMPKLERGVLTMAKRVDFFASTYIYLSHHIALTLLVNFCLIVACYFAFKSGLLFRLLIRLPGLSKLLNLRSSAMFFGILNILTDAGLPLATALEYATSVQGFERYGDDIEAIKETGMEQFFSSMANDGRFDVVTKTSILTGIAAGSFEAALKKIAAREMSRFDRMQQDISKVLEPAVNAVAMIMIAGLITPLYSSVLGAVMSALDRM